MLATTLLAVASMIPPTLNGTLPVRPVGNGVVLPDDFVAYLTGAVLLVEGRAPELFSLEAERQVQDDLLAPLVHAGAVGDFNKYMNPPLWAGIVAVLAPLGLLGASIVWRVLSVLGAGWALAQVVPRERRALVGALLLLSFTPFVVSVMIGQMVVVLLLAWGGWLARGRQGRGLEAGLWLSLLWLKPQYLPVPLVYLAWKRQWRQVGGVLLGGGLQALATLALLLWRGGLPNFADLTIFATPVANGTSVMINLRSAVEHLLPDGSPTVQVAAVALATLLVWAVLLQLSGREWHPADHRFEWEVLAVSAATVLTAYHNHDSGLVLLMPATALILTSGVAATSARTLLVLLVAVPALTLVNLPSNLDAYRLLCWASATGALLLGAAAMFERRQGSAKAAATLPAGCPRNA